MNRLAIRLAVAGGRGSVAGLALTAVAVAIGTAVLLYALSFLPAWEERGARSAWRTPTAAMRDENSTEDWPGSRFLWLEDTDRWRDRAVSRFLVTSLTDDAPTPPGIERLPAAGEAFVSPALAELLRRVPADELGNRIGTVVGTIGDDALRAPDELIAVVGAPSRQVLEAGGWGAVDFPSERRAPELPDAARLLIMLAVAGALAPVAAFVATATRLSAARRERRLAALRLVGATNAQVVRLAATEALLATVAGMLGGVALFVGLRPLVAQVPLSGVAWFAESLSPPLLPALVLLAAVPVVGVLAAMAGLRRVATSPLGIQRRVVPPPPRATRIVPLVASIAILLVAIAAYRGAGAESPGALLLIGGAFAGVVGGIALAGPWLTALVGRALGRSPRRGAATLLAARRIADDPRGSFGAIAGVIMAVFVATAFVTISSSAPIAGSTTVLGMDLVAGVLRAQPPAYSSADPELVERVEGLPGVTAVVAVRDVMVSLGGADGDTVGAWVAPCAAVARIAPSLGITCHGRAVHASRTLGSELRPGMFTLTSQASRLDGGASATARLSIGQEGIGELGGDAVPWDPAGISLLIDPAAVAEVDRLGVTTMFVMTDGTPAAEDRVRTAILAAEPGSWLAITGDTVDLQRQFAEIGRIIALGLIGTMALAGASLAVAVTVAVLDRRRQFVSLRRAGMSAGGLRRMVLLQAGAPLVAVTIASALLAVAVTEAILAIASIDLVALPATTIAGLVVVSIAIAMAVVLLVLPALERQTRADSLRTE